MITKRTKDNKGLYDALFVKATEALQGQFPDGNPSVTSLDEYFSQFGTLTQLDTIYNILPLDEPVFEIDANKRTVTVPKDFANNGIAVEGDHFAEVLFFSVDRYFDTTDLYDPVTATNPGGMHIVIQWESADGKKGVSNAVWADTSVLADDGKIIFGWIICPEIAEATGTVKFSVRFYRVENNQLVFSLNTQTSTVNVKAGLHYDFNPADNNYVDADVIACDHASLIKARAKNSIYTGTEVAAEPQFDVGIVPADHTHEKDEKDADNNIVAHIVDLENGSRTFEVVASAAGGGGIISYDWVGTDLNGNNIPMAGEDVFIAATAPINNSLVYYTKVTTEGADAYKVVVGPTEANIADYYVKRNSCTVNQAGTYVVVATNSCSSGATASVTSDTVKVPGPGAITATYENEENKINGKIPAYIAADNTCTLKVTNATVADGDTVKYVWSNDANIAAAQQVISIPEADVDTYDTDVTVTVNAERNNSIGTTPSTATFRITAPAVEPRLVPASEKTVELTGKFVYLEEHVYIDGLSDDIQCQWFKWTEDENDSDIIIPATAESENDSVVECDSKTTVSTDANGVVYHKTRCKVTSRGKYYCKITNILNGSSATIRSAQNTADMFAVYEA